MRRPRSKLEVSTFPFLAVLLCAMGSLLLLLFIMDRRAKIAAQHRTTEELAERVSRTKAEEEARQREWEKAKQLLHQSLVEQQTLLAAESNGLEQNLSEADKKRKLGEARHGDLKQRIAAEGEKIGEIQLAIENQRAGLQKADQKETMSKAELIAAAKELADLENAFLRLKALRERDKQIYSVVPYRGKRGDLRPPIYVECVRDGVIFHPEKKVLQAWEFTPASIRGEVEHRFGPLAVQKSNKAKGTLPVDEPKGPYVLFLIRPDGIDSYYKAQSALKGFQLDFGYELVDAGWDLEFSGDTYAKNTRPSQPVKPANLSDAPKPIAVPAFPFSTGSGSANGNSPTGQGSLLAPSFPIPPPAGINGGAGGGNVGSGNPLVPPPSGTAGNLPRTGMGSFKPNQGPTFVPISRSPSLVPIASSDTAPKPIGSTESTNGAGNTTKPQSSGASEGVSPINAPIPGNNVSGQRPAGESTSPGTDSESSEPARKSRPSVGGDPDKSPASAPPLSKMLGNRDFVITIECHADYVTVSPGSITYRWTAANFKETDQALTQTIVNLIARRQASVRPGEPPYRPLIRFHRSAEGLRTYYHVYPLLEHLRIPMTRENVEE